MRCRECQFNHTEAFQCPFFSSGTFSVEERDSCPDFMQVRHLRQHEALCADVLPDVGL